jgi:hypothetical protein
MAYCQRHSLVPQRPPLPGLHLIVTFTGLDISLDEPRTFTLCIPLPVTFTLPLAVFLPAAETAARRVVDCRGNNRAAQRIQQRRISNETTAVAVRLKGNRREAKLNSSRSSGRQATLPTKLWSKVQPALAVLGGCTASISFSMPNTPQIAPNQEQLTKVILHAAMAICPILAK